MTNAEERLRRAGREADFFVDVVARSLEQEGLVSGARRNGTGGHGQAGGGSLAPLPEGDEVRTALTQNLWLRRR